MAHKSTNRLIHEKSPYLLQHAHNPVDWYPWGEEAFSKAIAENKPILLSIGYSSCHWCHVMEKESFENEAIAALMNKYFVCIKVDREERPDIDQIYQNAFQLFMGRGGGWPLTMFLTPQERIPFYGGTYFPPEPRYGMPSFPQVLEGVAMAYHHEPHKVRQNADFIIQALTSKKESAEPPQEPAWEGVVQSISTLGRLYDPQYGGFGTGTKFPSTQSLENLLRLDYWIRGQKGKESIHQESLLNPSSSRILDLSILTPPAPTQSYLEMVTHTLTRMAEGGIYDHLGGGFHRYSVDRKWLVPHFEKMLYDNALLIPLYLSAFQLTGEPFYKQVAQESFAYVEREMLAPSGGFYSTQDADSQGVEGKFFLWSQKEILDILGEDVGNLFNLRYGVTKEGNFEGENILHIAMPLSALAQVSDQSQEDLKFMLTEAKQKLFTAREQRIKPSLDDKILVSWNGLMISALFKGYQVLGEERYFQMAQKSIDFIFSNLYQQGRLISVYKDGPSKIQGYLDDYAFFIAALLDGYESVGTGHVLTPLFHYLERAEELAQSAIDHFWDAEGGGFFFTANDHEALLDRPKSFVDQSLPSGNGVMAMNLLRLYYYTGKDDYLKKGEVILKTAYPEALKAPYGYGSILSALDFYLATPWEIVLAGRGDNPALLEWIWKVFRLYLPNRILWIATEKSVTEGRIPPIFLEGLALPEDGKPVARLCHNKRCLSPIHSLDELEKRLVQG